MPAVDPRPCEARRRAPAGVGRLRPGGGEPLPAAPRHAMSAAVVARVAAADLAVVAALDDGGHPWAWPLAGAPGLLGALGPGLLRVHPPAPLPLELAWQITATPSVSVLAVDMAAGRCALVAGGAAMAGDRLALAIDEAAGGTPAAVAPRSAAEAPGAWPELGRPRARLDAAQRALVRTSEIVFVATRDAGGRTHVTQAGTLRASADRLTLLEPAAGRRARPAPRALGARAAGELAADPRACVLALSPRSGRWLQVLVAATPACHGRPRGERSIHARVLAVVEGSGLARRWSEPARTLPLA